MKMVFLHSLIIVSSVPQDGSYSPMHFVSEAHATLAALNLAVLRNSNEPYVLDKLQALCFIFLKSSTK